MPKNSNIVRTTISLTAMQMSGCKRKVEVGEYPDLTEVIRAAVLEFLTNHPTMGGAALCQAQ